jgi:plasmid stability protein
MPRSRPSPDGASVHAVIPCSRSAGINVHAMLETVNTMDRNMQHRKCQGPRALLINTLARCPHCWHHERMAIQINIRNVPERVRDELAARAALQGKSMQEFLRAELERLAARPSMDAWLQRVRDRKRATQTRISPKQILENRNADRR